MRGSWGRLLDSPPVRRFEGAGNPHGFFRQEHQYVESRRAFCLSGPLEVAERGRGQMFLFGQGDGFERFLGRNMGSRLDLKENDGSVLFRNQIQLTRPRPEIAGQNTITLFLYPFRGAGFAGFSNRGLEATHGRILEPAQT